VSLEIRQGLPTAIVYDAYATPAENRLTFNKDIADDQWHHVAMSFTGGDDDTLRLYVDGRLAGLQTQAAGSLDVSGWSVGSLFGADEYFGGAMDDVRMYARALGDGGVSQIGQTAGGDVAELYALGVPEPGTLVLLVCGLLAVLALRWTAGRR